MEKVFIPSNPKTGLHKSFGFVEFDHKESVPYSIQLLDGICLFGRPLKVKTATKTSDSAGDPALTGAGVDDELHPTLGQRLSPTAHPVLDHVLRSNAHDQDLPHPTLGQRLSPPPPFANNDALHPTLGQRLSLPNGMPLPFPLPPGPLPLFVNNNHLPPPPLFDASNNNRSLFPQTLPPPPLPQQRSSLPSLLNFPPPPPSHPLFPLDTAAAQGGDAFVNSSGSPSVSNTNCIPLFPNKSLGAANHHDGPDDYAAGASNCVPLFPSKSSDSANHQDNLGGYVDDCSGEVYHENGDGIDMEGQPHVDHTHTHLHEDRVVHIEDKPSWVTRETKDQIRDYHLRMLEETLSKYKEQFAKR